MPIINTLNVAKSHVHFSWLNLGSTLGNTAVIPNVAHKINYEDYY